MLFDLEVEPDLPEIAAELNRSLEDVTAQIIRVIATDAPGEMQELMALSSPSGNPAKGGGHHSAVGEPPAIVTRNLFRSLQGRAISPTEAEIEMAASAFYLDPLFEGQGKGGGYLDRPFIEKGIIRAIAKSLADLPSN